MEITPQLVISLCAMIVALLGYLRTGRKDDDAVKEGLIKANIKLDQVCATTNETRSDIKSLNKDMNAIDLRVTAIERDVKSAFVQIDEIKSRIK